MHVLEESPCATCPDCFYTSGLLSHASILCARTVVNLLTIFFCTVQWQNFYGKIIIDGWGCWPFAVFMPICIFTTLAQFWGEYKKTNPMECGDGSHILGDLGGEKC